MLTKFPFVYFMLDQTALRIAEILVEVVPINRVPETLLSDCGTNLLSHLKDACKLLGIEYHSLPSTVWWLRDSLEHWCIHMLPSVASSRISTFMEYCGHTGMCHMKPLGWINCPTSIWIDYCTPTEAAFATHKFVNISDYCEELTTTLSHAHELAAESVQKGTMIRTRRFDHSLIKLWLGADQESLLKETSGVVMDVPHDGWTSSWKTRTHHRSVMTWQMWTVTLMKLKQEVYPLRTSHQSRATSQDSYPD